jgi:hypothetical protein
MRDAGPRRPAMPARARARARLAAVAPPVFLACTCLPLCRWSASCTVSQLCALGRVLRPDDAVLGYTATSCACTPHG